MQSAELSYNLDQEINKLISIRNTAVFEIGKRFKAIKDNDYFTELGFESFNAYVASKKFRPKTARAYVHIYELFVDGLGYDTEFLAGIPWARLQLIAPHVKGKTKEEADEWVYKAKELSPGDLRTELLEYRANEGREDKISYPQFWRCGQCGKWVLPKDMPICLGHES